MIAPIAFVIIAIYGGIITWGVAVHQYHAHPARPTAIWVLLWLFLAVTAWFEYLFGGGGM